jgi:hypothetical protein
VKCGCAAAPLRRPAGPPGPGSGVGGRLGGRASRLEGGAFRVCTRCGPSVSDCAQLLTKTLTLFFFPTRRLCYLSATIIGSGERPRVRREPATILSFAKCRRRRGREPSLARPARRSAGAASCLESSALKAKPIGPSQKARRGTQKNRAHPFRSSSDRHEDTRPSPAQLGVL